ncbi:MAG: small basic protein [Candidatus Omnitrophica bacterium]|nr:small basic protein [Candidatus Omnitrophota bacterium]
MSLHPSLKVSLAGSQQRSVMTRIERIKDMMKKGTWKEDQDVTALPKTKSVRVKARRKAAKAEEADTKAAAGAPAKAAPAAKAAPKKEAPKK